MLILLVGILAGAGATFLPRVAAGQSKDAGHDPTSATGDEPNHDGGDTSDPAVTSLRETARLIRDLGGGRLAADVAPQTLFDVSLEDESAVALEIARLGALLREVDSEARGSEAVAARGVIANRLDAGAARSGGRAPDVPPELFRARVAVDRARLAFYALPAHRRDELLAIHTERQKEAGAPSEAEQREKEAEEQREKALQAARDAHSEAERLVAEEYARLLGVERRQAAFEKTLDARREVTAARRESVLGWQRRAREGREASSTPDAVDELYDGLRRALVSARDDLDLALANLADAASAVPHAGSEPLSGLQAAAVDTGAVREERTRVETAATRLVQEEKRLQEEHASQLLDEIDALNNERLALLPFLSSGKRSAITGFTTVGAAQAASEVRQLILIARYHRYAALSWLESLRSGGKAMGLSIGGALVVTLEWLAAIGAFLWMRRRTPLILHGLRKRARQHDREEGLTSPSLASRGAAFAVEVHRPVELLGLALILSWLLPDAANDLLEIQLVTVIVEWILGGALIVVLVNALAGSDHHATKAESDVAALRLRSLRLVGRVIVAFGLVLVLTSRLVGPGTIYRWVASTCWFASIPVLLLLVRWWQTVVFARVEQIRNKSPFEKWVLANRAGRQSVVAATAGAVYLFGRGVMRTGRSRLGRFNVTRRALAYLFRRELGKLEAERADLGTARISDAAFDALGPDAHHDHRVPTDVDQQIERLIERIRCDRGGVVAVVGHRGMGKTFLLRRLREQFPDTLLMAAPAIGAAGPCAALAERLGLPPGASLEQAASALSAAPVGRALLLDDAQRFVQPVMGGLAMLDALLATASRSSTKTTWVFALDQVIWQFLQRARGSRPLFDEVIRLEPWREEQIIELLRARTARAKLKPTFERLLEKLPPNADALDKQQALDRRARSYYRLLWDYAAGNPGVALHMWRRSLGSDPDGSTHVRFFQAPDTTDLQFLPDQTIFVLRAVLQLAPATPADIGRATMLGAADVTDALRYAKARAYVEESQGGYTVSWTWFRAISLFLQRRHLLVAS